MRKPAFCICENKDADQLHGNRELSAFVFATRKVQSLYFLNPKFQTSSHLLWLYSLVCIEPGRKPRRPVFSKRGSYRRKTYAKISNSSNQNPNPALKTKTGNDKKIANSQNIKRTYGQPSEQLFPKMWSLSNPNRTKNNINTRKVKRNPISDTKNRQKRTQSHE